jgi:hypothetical protein
LQSTNPGSQSDLISSLLTFPQFPVKTTTTGCILFCLSICLSVCLPPLGVSLSLSLIGLWQWVAMDSLKFHPGPPCPTFLRPVGGPPPKRPYACFLGGLPAVFYRFGHPTPYACTFLIQRCYQFPNTICCGRPCRRCCCYFRCCCRCCGSVGGGCCWEGHPR